MYVGKIRKRDGTLVPFDKAKIRIAMEKAARAVNSEADLRPYNLISDHVLRYIQIRFKDAVPDVESIQDLVERTLMEYGLFDIAKEYILYRSERAKIREAKKDAVIEAVKASRLTYTDRKGQAKKIDIKKISRRLADAAVGLEDAIDRTALIKEFEAALYDSITESELDNAIVFAARALIERDPAYSKLATRLDRENLYAGIIGPTTKANFNISYRESFVKNVRHAVKTGRLQKGMLDFNLTELAAKLDPARDDAFEYIGYKTLLDRYLLRDAGGEIVLETPQAFWMRVAMGISMNESKKDKNKWAAKFYDLFSSMRYVPSTPTLFHAGTVFPQLSSCYLNTVQDDLEDIFKSYSDNAQLSKYSGGIGTDWTNIRGTGALIKKTNVGSQGLIPFLKIANDVTVAINRSGKRRGATCVYLECWHYDFEDFLDLKRNTGDERRRTHDMNTATWIPDLFMKRVNEGGKWTLFSPDETPDLHHIYGKKFDERYRYYEEQVMQGDIKLYKTLEAKDLWRRMLTSLFETGHPWVTFKDPSNIRSPQDHVGVIHHSNLCTEIMLNTSADETAVCNLGSVNLSLHMKDGMLDQHEIAATVKLAMRSLDNVIDLNFYPTKEARLANIRHRPVGIGIMGFADALYKANVGFDSEEAVEFADFSMEVVAYNAILASALLARERGTYESYKGSKWDRGILPIDTLDLLEAERETPIAVSREGKLDWKPVRAAVASHGMRNSNTMAIAPTATISNISGCFPCIEPIYKNLYVKSNMSGEFTIVNNYLVEDLKELGLWGDKVLDEIKRQDGSIQDIDYIPPSIKAKYKEAFEVSAEWLLKLAAYRGKWIDQSQSLNIFVKGISGRWLSDIYMFAWHLGLKTTYYLRTTAASGIEKSTLELAKKNLVVEPQEPVAVAAAPNVVNAGKALKVCLIDDPDCESCQ